MHNAIDNLNRFLDIATKNNNKEQRGLAFKRLSEVEAKNGNTAKAIEYLAKVLSLANEGSSTVSAQATRSAQAEATLGLGLLLNQ